MRKRLTAGFADRVITPPLGLDLCGYGFYLDRKAETVLDDLKVRALFLSDGSASLMMISCDLIGLPIEYCDRLRSGIAQTIGLPVERVLIACTHTHSGPATQSMAGLGEVSPAYMESLAKNISSAAEEAAASPKRARLRTVFEAIEPIGYNRRTNDFRGIDPWLKALVLRTEYGPIYLLNYSCHAVVLGRGRRVSADWPGAWIREAEPRGDRLIFFQGFCGDIDPVTQLNRWGEGTGEDLRYYGDLLTRRLRKTERYSLPEDDVALSAAEARIRVPLRIWEKQEIEDQVAAFRKAYVNFSGVRRFGDWWRSEASRVAAEMRKNPFMENVPIQALSIGHLRFLALPGEVFCGIGLELRNAFSPLFTIGYANGYIGYVPTGEAYRCPTDYAAFYAPMFTNVFPFRPEIEGLILSASRKVLKSV